MYVYLVFIEHTPVRATSHETNDTACKSEHRSPPKNGYDFFGGGVVRFSVPFMFFALRPLFYLCLLYTRYVLILIFVIQTRGHTAKALLPPSPLRRLVGTLLFFSSREDNGPGTALSSLVDSRPTRLHGETVVINHALIVADHCMQCNHC